MQHSRHLPFKSRLQTDHLKKKRKELAQRCWRWSAPSAPRWMQDQYLRLSLSPATLQSRPLLRHLRGNSLKLWSGCWSISGEFLRVKIVTFIYKSCSISFHHMLSRNFIFNNYIYLIFKNLIHGIKANF